MDNTITNHTNPVTYCEICAHRVETDDQFCNNCGYPLKGPAEDQYAFKKKHAASTINMVDYKKKLKNAENTLYWLAALFVVVAVVLFFQHKDDEEVLAYCIPNIVLAVVFLLLGTYTKKKPLVCLISGFSLYVIILALGAINDPKTIISGIYIKIIIIGFLVRGIKSAVEVDRIRKESNIG